MCGLVYLRADNRFEIRRLLGEQFRSSSSLTEFLAECNIEKIDSICSEETSDKIRNKISEWEESNKQGEDEPHIVNGKYDYSVGKIVVDDKFLGMGFLMKWKQYRTLCITCTHLFIRESIENIEFVPLISEENNESYLLELCYPKTIEEINNGMPATKDLVIFNAQNITHGLYERLYDYNDLDKRNMNDIELQGYAFPVDSPIGSLYGDALTYIYKGKTTKDYCTLVLQDEMDCKGFSGTPLINSEGKICAIHKAKGGPKKVLGISMKAIEKRLKEGGLL